MSEFTGPRPLQGRTVMVQGTASHVGKSWIAAGLCRLLVEDGWRVLPFKGQNMSNNAAVTADGGEIGRAQALQAEAAGVPPHTDMNPVLLKPTGNLSSQVVLQGRPIGVYRASAYYAEARPLAQAAIRESLHRLRCQADIVVIEGAGSPVELNLRDRDLANMALAELADAPVLLVADIDRGGVFASLLGTLDLLRPHERARVRGVLVNRFRGDPSLFADGVRILEERGGVPVLGVIPWLDLALPEEDGVALQPGEPGRRPESAAADVFVAVVHLPRISNFTDFGALGAVPGVRLCFVDRPAEAAGADLLILPGTKNTVADLGWLRRQGWEAAIAGAPLVLGVCGGMQMLGRQLRDPEGREDLAGTTPGLGLLDLVTTFSATKRTVETEATVVGGPAWLPAGHRLRGYEIRAGRSETAGEWLTPAGLSAASPDGRVLGSYLHGLFDDRVLRAAFVNRLRERRGLPPLPETAFGDAAQERQESLHQLAAALRRHMDCAALYRICGLAGRRTPQPP